MTHHGRRHVDTVLSGPGRRLRPLVAFLVAVVTVMMTAPAATPVAAQTPGADASAAIEVHVSACPPGYSGGDWYDACHGNGLADVGVHLTSAGAGIDQTKTTVQPQSPGAGVVQFGDIPAGTYTIGLNLPDENQQYITFCSLEDSDARVPMSPENARQGQVEIGAGQVLICDYSVVPSADDQPDTGGQASLAIQPMVCPAGTDPASGHNTLAGVCTEQADNLTFTWGNASGTLDTYTTDGNPETRLVIDNIAPGTYTLYSDIPLEDATEVLYCTMDGGDRYQKSFNGNGVTTFDNIAQEQIACDWFIVPAGNDAEPTATTTPSPEPTQPPVVTPTLSPTPDTGNDDEGDRGDETGASLTVHLSLCPPGYSGDEIYDTCHDAGISDQVFTLTGPDGDVEQTTIVPQTPGPGIVEFTALPAGDYELAGGPPGDFGAVEIYCTTQPDGERIDATLDGARAAFALGTGQDVLCDWYYIPENSGGQTPTPTATLADRAEILVTLHTCEPGAQLAGATYADFTDACTDTRDGVPFRLSAGGATPLSANTGASGPGAVRFYDLRPGDYTMTPELPSGLGSAGVFCQLDGGDRYQKTLTNGATTFVNVEGESITCDWFASQAMPEPPEPEGPSGSITIREFLCDEDAAEIGDWEQECEAGSSGATFTVASSGGAIELTSATNTNGIATFSDLPDGFYTLKQNEGAWCRARAERVDSQSRVIVENGQNTDVYLYECSQVTDLPGTGTGTGIIGAMESPPAWWETVSRMQLSLMGVGVLGLFLLLGRRLRA